MAFSLHFKKLVRNLHEFWHKLFDYEIEWFSFVSLIAGAEIGK
jgi:hypothetical protein